MSFIGEDYQEMRIQKKRAKIKPTKPSSTGDDILGKKEKNRFKKGLKRLSKRSKDLSKIKIKRYKKKGKKGFGLGKSVVYNPWLR